MFHSTRENWANVNCYRGPVNVTHSIAFFPSTEMLSNPTPCWEHPSSNLHGNWYKTVATTATANARIYTRCYFLFHFQWTTSRHLNQSPGFYIIQLLIVTYSVFFCFSLFSSLVSFFVSCFLSFEFFLRFLLDMHQIFGHHKCRHM